MELVECYITDTFKNPNAIRADYCCGKHPIPVTDWMTGDWEGLLCRGCDRVVYGDPEDSKTILHWNAGGFDN